MNQGWAFTNRSGEGKAAPAKEGDTVEVEYAAYIWDGLDTRITKYESTLDMAVGRHLRITVGEAQHVTALDEALREMRAGERTDLVVTPAKGERVIIPNKEIGLAFVYKTGI